MSLGEIIGKNRTTGVIKVCCLTPLSLYILLGSKQQGTNKHHMRVLKKPNSCT